MVTEKISCRGKSLIAITVISALLLALSGAVLRFGGLAIAENEPQNTSQYASIDAKTDAGFRVYANTTGAEIKDHLIVTGVPVSSVEGGNAPQILDKTEYTVKHDGAELADDYTFSEEAGGTLSLTVELDADETVFASIDISVTAATLYTSIRVTVRSGAEFTTDLTAAQLNSSTYFTVEGSKDGTAFETISDHTLLSVSIEGGHLVPNQGNSVTFTYLPTGARDTASISGSSITAAAIESATVYVNPAYSLYNGSYYRTPDGYAAFVKGMTVAGFMKGLVIEVTYPNSKYTLALALAGNGNTFTAETGETVTVTVDDPNGTSTGVSATVEDITHTSVSAALSSPLYLEDQKIVGLAVKNLDEYLSYFDAFTSSTVIYETDIEGAIFPVYNDGSEGGYLSAGDYVIEGNLAPNGKQILDGFAALNEGKEYFYDASIYVVLSADSSVRAAIDIVDVKFEEPDSMGNISGAFARQTAFAEFVLSGLTIDFNYSTGSASVPLDSISNLCSLQYFDVNGEPMDHLSVKVNKISLTVQVNGVSRKKEQNNIIRNGRNTLISATDVELPIFDRSIMVFDPRGTYRTIEFSNDSIKDSATVTVARKSESGASVEIADAYDKAEGKIKFTLSGEYTVTVKLETNGDFQWVSDPLRVDNYTLVYTVQVDKATINLSLAYSDGADRVYGTLVEPANSVTAKNVGTGAAVDVFDTVQTGDREHNPVYKFYYYDAASSAASATATAPRDVGSYYVFVKTDATDYYNAAQSDPILFDITKKLISTAVLDSPVFDKDKTYSASRFIDPNEFVAAYGDSAANVIGATAVKTVTDVDASVPADERETLYHAGTYTVDITINGGYYRNYGWEDSTTDTVEVEFVIRKRAVHIYVTAATDLVYGNAANDPKPIPANTDGYIDFGAAYYYENYGGSGAPESGLLTDPDFTALDAGKYAVYYKDITANTANRVYASDIAISGDAYVAFDIARKKITKIGFPTSRTFTYDGTAKTFTLDNWDPSYAAILEVTVNGVLADGVTAAVGCSFDYSTGAVYVRDAGTYTVNIAFKSDINNHEWNGVWSGQDSDLRADLNSDDDGKMYEVEQAVVTINFGTLGFDFDENKGQGPDPTVSVNEMGVTLTVTAEYFADENKTAIDADKIKNGKPFAADTYYVFVKDLVCANNADGADYSLAVNYKLPDKVSERFDILSAALTALTFDNGTLAHSAVYKGCEFTLAELISNWLTNAGGTPQKTEQLDIVGVTSANNGSTMRNVDTYAISVKPAPNYKWAVGDEDATVTLTLTVTKAVIGIAWENSYDFTYSGGDKTVAPTLTVVAGSGDVVTADVKYKARGESGSVPSGADVEPNNAGRYFAYVYKLKGAAENNYSIPTDGTQYKDFVIKKAIISPISYTVSTSNPTFGDGGKVTFESATAGWASLVTASVSRVLDSAWLNGAAPVNHLNVSGYANGVFAYGDAGIYSAVFTIDDSANYCYNASEREDFDNTGKYALTLNDFVKVERMQLTAPKLGNRRAMEYNNVTAFDFGTSVDGVNVTVRYGRGNKSSDGGKYTDEANSILHGLGTVPLSERGKYYVVFKIDGDPYNYLWKIDGNDAYGSGYIDGLGTVVYGETVSEVYLHYAIINKSLDIMFSVSAAGGYKFGDNGEGGSVTLENLVVMSGADVGTIDAEKSKNGFEIVYEFKKTGAGNSASSVGTVVKTWNGTDWAYKASEGLVNNLVWDSGDYLVSVELVFGKADGAEDADFQDLGFRDMAFVVRQLELEVLWSVADGDSAVTGGGTSFSSVYDGKEHALTATVANMPKRYDGDTATVGVTVGNAVDGEAVGDAKTYTIVVTAITGDDRGNFIIPTGGLSATLDISPRRVFVAGNNVAAHVYGDALGEHELGWSYVGDSATDGDKRFIDEDNVSVMLSVVKSDDSTVDVQTAVVGGYYVKPTVSDTNYQVTATDGSFAIVSRAITIALRGSGKNTYGVAPDLYTADVFAATLTDGSGDAIVNDDDPKAIFTLGLDGVSDLSDVAISAGVYTVTASACGNANYSVKFANVGSATYEIKNADITNEVVNVYGGADGAEYDADWHSVLLDTSTATVVNGTAVNPLTWFIDEGEGFVEYDPEAHKVKDVSTAGYKYNFKITAPNHNDLIIGGQSDPTDFVVRINKATLKVSVNLSVTYGEQNPADANYLMTVEEFTKEGGIYSVTKFKKGDDITNIGASPIAGEKMYSVPNYTSTSNVNADGYAIEFNKNSVISTNYLFESVDGVLTVKPFEFDVSIDDKSSQYYADGDYKTLSATYTVKSVSTYDGTVLASPNGVNLDALYDLHCEVTSDGGKVTDPVKAGGYAITGALKAEYAVNYRATFSDGVYTVTPAELVSVTAGGYSEFYDEDRHRLATANAVTVDGSTVEYEYFVSETRIADIAGKDDDGAIAWIDNVPQSVDVWAKKYIYIRYTESNHATVYREVESEIKKAVSNPFKSVFGFANGSVKDDAVGANDVAAWTYGKVSDGNPNGYDPENGNKVTEPSATFKRVSDGVDQYIEVTLKIGATVLGNVELTAGNTVGALIQSIFDAGKFGAGNDYSVTVYMAGTGNYPEINITYYFRIAKKDLTVTANSVSVVYGEDIAASAYADAAKTSLGYTVTGYVNNGVADDTWATAVGTAAPKFTTSYAKGKESGAVGNYALSLDASGVTSDNYDIIYVYKIEDGVFLDVTERTVTIKIDDKTNSYNLRDDNPAAPATLSFGTVAVAGSYTFFDDKDDVIKLRTDALANGNPSIKTNNVRVDGDGNVIPYPIYATFGTYGDGVSYGKNYSIKFVGCSYTESVYGSVTDTDAVRDGGVLGAGSFTITPATLSMDVKAPSQVYDGTKKEWQIKATGDDTVQFNIVYKQGETVLDEAPVNVGSYSVTYSSKDTNYIVGGTTTQTFPITQGTLTVSVSNATVQYGTELPADGHKMEVGDEVLFTGVAAGYKFSADGQFTTGDDIAEKIIARETDKGTLDLSALLFSYGSYTVRSAPAENAYKMSVNCADIPSHNYNIVMTTDSSKCNLSVIKRNVTVTVHGYNSDGTAHDYEAFGIYNGRNHSSDIRDSLSDSSILNGYFTAPTGWAGQSGNDLTDLNLSLSISAVDNAFDIGYYRLVPSYSTNNYNVTFKHNDDGAGAYYEIRQKKLTVYAQGLQNGVYADTFAFTYGEIENFIVAFDGFENSENFHTLVSVGKAGGDYGFDTDYEAWESGVGTNIYGVKVYGKTDGDARRALWFKNYEIVYRQDVRFSVVPRVVTASTTDRVYTEDIVGGIINYHDGEYGATLNAVIAFGNIPADKQETYAPVYNDTYKGAGTTPNKVGQYAVTVELAASGNYKFADGYTWTYGNYNITPKPVSISWNKSSVNLDDGDTERIVVGYVKDIMEFGNRGFIHSYNDLNTTVPSANYVQSNNGLTFTVYANGTYTAHIKLNDAAIRNYYFSNANNDDGSVELYLVATSDTVDLKISIVGWKYGDTENYPSATVNGVTSGEIVYYYAPSGCDYAAIDNKFKGNSFTDSSWLAELDLSNFVSRTNWRANAGTHVVYGEYRATGQRAYFVFEIEQKEVGAPTFTVDGSNDTYTGGQLVLEIELDGNEVFVTADGLTMQNARNGIFLYATNAKTYRIEFTLASSDYKWSASAGAVDGVVAKTWTVKQANGKISSLTVGDITYGDIVSPSAKAEFGADVMFVFKAVTEAESDENAVEPADAIGGWSGSAVNYSEYGYWVKAISDGTDNYTSDIKYAKFFIAKKEVRVTARGGFVYGNTFSATGGYNSYVFTSSDFTRGDTSSVIHVSDSIRYELDTKVVQLPYGTYGITLKTDTNGYVIGMTADNYAVKAVKGTFTVSKRPLAVTVGNAESYYSLAPDLSGVALSADSLAFADTVDMLGINLSTTATDRSNVDTYLINIASHTSQNYDITFTPGLFTVKALPIMVNIKAGGGEYGGIVTEPEIGSPSSVVSGVDMVRILGELSLTFRYVGTSFGNVAWNSEQMPVLAGRYTARVTGVGSNFTLSGSQSEVDFIIEKKTIEQNRISVKNAVYDKSNHLPEIIDDVYGDRYYTVGSGIYIVAATHQVFLTLVDPYNTTWDGISYDTCSIPFVIEKADNEIIGGIIMRGWTYGDDAVLPQATTVYGTETQYNWRYYDSAGKLLGGVPAAAGDYFVALYVPEGDNYKALDETRVTFTIARRTVAAPVLVVVDSGDEKNDVYTGGELYSAVIGFNNAVMSMHYDGSSKVSGDNITLIAVNAGTYTVTFALLDGDNYAWNGFDGDVVRTWTIARKKISKPTDNNGPFIVSGKPIEYIPNGYDGDTMQIDGNVYGYGGEFTATVTLRDPSNYEWEDGTQEPVELTWKIVGVNVVFNTVVGVISGLAVVSLGFAAAQIILHRRKKRLVEQAMNAMDAEV